MKVEVLMGSFAMVSLALFAFSVAIEVVDDYRELHH